ncbi:ATP-binding cassette domain-containing protein [Salisediminibacterium beveridgei]|uniref:ABC transporter (ATP-binding protein) n=1 Tax=Salisediminibacterium beveridgei TaxID=632773 RepID=A0A1D7QVL4_9BACI|nr:ABC transporter ATP-binding protein [Salisediminibacterium beveridgei]AOM83050.1 ABC transporter (ATP-binding protein) [Salisediminibacterium beveridgei]
METMIEMKHVTKRYGKNEGLFDVNWTMNQTGLAGIIGPNGSGKTTLLKLIAGLLRPTSGSIKIHGRETDRTIGDQVAYLSELDSLYGFQTIRQAIRFHEKTISAFRLDKAEAMTNELALPMDKKIKHLSKGNRAKVKIILTLAREVSILVMDEPLSGLDPIVREDILKMIIRHLDVERQLGLISTHEVTEVEPYLDYVMFLHQGSIMLEGETDRLREEHGKSVVELMREVFV